MAGYRELLAVDWDKKAAKIFKMNFSNVPLWFGDIKRLDMAEINQVTGIKKGELDVLDGSPPCQGFSLAGKRRFRDDRNFLFNHYVRILRELQPKVFVIENVKGMICGKMRIIFSHIFKQLKQANYIVKCKILNSANYEVPQIRERVIFIGVRNDLGKEPTFPPHCKQKVFMKKLDERDKSFWDNKFYCDFIQDVGQLAHTVTCRGRLYWLDTQKELGIKSYAYAQSFPPDFKWLKSFHANKICIGNAVPPRMMFHIANHIKEVILN